MAVNPQFSVSTGSVPFADIAAAINSLGHGVVDTAPASLEWQPLVENGVTVGSYSIKTGEKKLDKGAAVASQPPVPPHAEVVEANANLAALKQAAVALAAGHRSPYVNVTLSYNPSQSRTLSVSVQEGQPTKAQLEAAEKSAPKPAPR